MVPIRDPRKKTKVARHQRRPIGDTLLTHNGRIYAQRPSDFAIEIWAGVTSRTNERVEIDGQGVVLNKDGKRYILHLWGDTPGAYLPH